MEDILQDAIKRGVDKIGQISPAYFAPLDLTADVSCAVAGVASRCRMTPDAVATLAVFAGLTLMSHGEGNT